MPGGMLGTPPAFLKDVSALGSPAALYQRLRFTGTTDSPGLFHSTKNEWIERILILDLKKCRDS